VDDVDFLLCELAREGIVPAGIALGRSIYKNEIAFLDSSELPQSGFERNCEGAGNAARVEAADPLRRGRRLGDRSRRSSAKGGAGGEKKQTALHSTTSSAPTITECGIRTIASAF